MAARVFCRIALFALLIQALTSSSETEFTTTSFRQEFAGSNGTNVVAISMSNDSNGKLSVGVMAAKRLAFQVGVGLQLYYLPVILVLGLVGNTLSILVMRLPHNRRISCGVYMGMLAVSDNALLVTVTYFHVIGYNLRSNDIWSGPMSDIECKIICYVVLTLSNNGVVLILAMTVDRFLAVYFPLKSAIWCSTKRAKLTIAFTAAAALVYSIPYLVYSQVIDNGKVCAAMIIQTPFSQAYTWFNLCVNCVVPFFVLLTLNTLIISTIRRRSKMFTTEGSSLEPGAHTVNSRERTLTIMLVLVSLAFLVLTVPVYIRMIVSTLVDTTSSVDTYAMYILMYHVTNKLFYTNNCCNFYLYCVGGSKFREDLRSLFCGRTNTQAAKSNRSLTSSTADISTISNVNQALN